MEFVRHLDGSGARIVEVGGKAAGLDRLVSHGLPVPSAVVITVDGYTSFVEHAGLRETVSLLSDSKIPTAPSGLNAAGTVPNGCATRNASVLCNPP